MPSHCPKCLNPLPDDRSGCEHCSAQLAQFQESLHTIVQRIESNEYDTVLLLLNAVIDSAPPERLAECYAIRGFAQLKQLDFQRAEDDCSEAISLDWEQAQTYAWRAAARGEQNKWHLAFDDLDRAYELGGPLQDRYLELMEGMSRHAREHFRTLAKIGALTANSFFERGWMYLRMNNFEKAVLNFNQALKREPKHPWASVGLAEVFIKRVEFKGLSRVHELCDNAMVGSPACRRQALKILAQLHWQTGDIIHAKSDLKNLAEMAVDSVPELVQCAEMMMRLGDHLAAIDLLNQILERDGSRVLTLLKRGDCFAAIFNYGLAVGDYSQYLDSFPRAVSALVRRAKVHFASGRLSRALADLNLAVELEPSNYEANLRLGQVYCELEKFDLALNHCRLAVQFDGQQAEGYAVLASICNRLSDYTQTIEEYSRSIELARTIPEKAQYRFLRGSAAYQNDDIELALADFSQAAEERPHHAGSWIWKAATCARHEDWAGAILALQQAIQLRPDVAEQYQKMGQPVAEKAVQYYRRHEQRQGDNKQTSLYLHRGMAYQFLGQHQLAVDDFTEALKLMPTDHELLVRRGQALTQLGNLVAAIDDFTTALNRCPKDHSGLYYRAVAQIANRDLPAAKVDLLSAIRIAPNQPRYLLLLGDLEQRSGNRKSALNALDQAIQLDPTNPQSYRLRGTIHLELEDYLSAIRDFTHSLQLLPTQPELLVRRAESYLKSNQPLTALEDFEEALSRNDRFAKAYSGRASVLVIQQRHEYALIWLTKAIHRFQAPAELGEVIYSRGKVFYQMARYIPAISDFTLAMDLLRDDPMVVAAARFARALAKIHDQQFESAEKDLKKLLIQQPRNQDFRAAAEWLNDRTAPRPSCLYPPAGVYRPTRPVANRTGVVLTNGSVSKWQSDPPYNMWIVRTEEKTEYGPIPLPILADWASEGRLINGMRLLRSDWSKWKRIEKIFPEITPLESVKGLIEEFPELDLKARRETKET